MKTKTTTITITITYTTAQKLLKEAKVWVLESDEVFVPQFLLSKGLPSSIFDTIAEKYPELIPRIDEVNRMDEAKIVGLMAKGRLGKSVGEFILTRYYTDNRGKPTGKGGNPNGDDLNNGVSVHLDY